MGDLVDQKIGSVGELKLDFVNGNLVLTLQGGGAVLSNGVQLAVSASASVSPAVFIKLIEDAIPGDVDNAILDALAKAFIPAAPQA